MCIYDMWQLELLVGCFLHETVHELQRRLMNYC